MTFFTRDQKNELSTFLYRCLLGVAKIVFVIIFLLLHSLLDWVIDHVLPPDLSGLIHVLKVGLTAGLFAVVAFLFLEFVALIVPIRNILNGMIAVLMFVYKKVDQLYGTLKKRGLHKSDESGENPVVTVNDETEPKT